VKVPTYAYAFSQNNTVGFPHHKWWATEAKRR
jgi:hypothetical protein